MGKKFSLKPLVSKIERTEIESKSQHFLGVGCTFVLWMYRNRKGIFVEIASDDR